MKKLLALIVLLLGLTDTQAQNFTYRPLKEFHGDTIAFLKSNFYDQRSYFAGKKFGVLLELYICEICHSKGAMPMAHRHSETQTMRATSAVPGYVLWKILFCQETPLAPYMLPLLT